MRRVLFLAYFFPPLGGAGVQRSAKFVRYLPRNGYEPVVVTGPGAATGRWAPTDASLAADVPEETDIRRVSGPVPSMGPRWRRRAERLLPLQARFATWWTAGATDKGRHVAAVDLVYASMSPFETAVAAERLSCALAVPWVADLRDPWALDEMSVYPTGLHRRLERSRMARRLSSAAAIIMNNPEALAAARAAFPDLRLTASIPNGYDASDFSGTDPERRNDKFRIVHTGYLHTDLGLQHRRSRTIRRLLGGAEHGVDFLTRSHVILLQALEQLVNRRPEMRARLEVCLAGVLSAEDEAIVAAFPYRELVRMPGYLSHEDTVTLVRSADLLFLPMQDLPIGVRARVVPGKTYEYLAAGRPILAALPDGDTRDLLAQVPHASLCRPADGNCLMQVIEARFDEFRASGRRASSETPSAAPFERKVLTAQLAAVFDGVLGVAPNADPRPTAPL